MKPSALKVSKSKMALDFSINYILLFNIQYSNNYLKSTRQRANKTQLIYEFMKCRSFLYMIKLPLNSSSFFEDQEEKRNIL